MHYYTFNIGDYKSHTEHLSEMEDLAYRRLLDWYYLHETPIPIEITEVARQIRMRSHSDCIAVVLQEFFERTDDGWIHHRANREIAKVGEKSGKASMSAKARWDKQRQANEMRTHSESNATQDTIPNTHNTRHKTQNTKNAVACPADVSPDCWEAFISHRKAVKALVTDRVVNTIRNEADKAGIPLEDALDEVVARGWKGFKADWYKPQIRADQPRKTQHQLNEEATARALGLIPKKEVYDVETTARFLD